MRRIAALLIVITIIMTFGISAYADNPSNSSAGSSTTAASGTNNDEGGTGGTAVTGDLPKDIISILESPKTENTNISLLTITRPEDDMDSTYKKSYVISGDTYESKYTDVRVAVAKYNSETKEYELLKNSDDESSWDVGTYGAFTKEVGLTKGDNKLRILAYRTTETGDYSKDNVQVYNFTVKLLDSNILTKIINGAMDIKDIFQMFGNDKDK